MSNFKKSLLLFFASFFLMGAATRTTYGNRGLDEVAVHLEPGILNAIDQIWANFGDKVDVKPKTLLKFGRSEVVGTGGWATLMHLPSGQLNETYVSTNIIDSISSASGADTQDIVVEGHTIDGNGDFIFSSQTVTLAGQTKTALTTPLVRVTRAYNNGSTDLTGPVYVYEDGTVTAGVPDTASEVHLIIPASYNQSFKAATTFSKSDYYIITQAYASVNEKTAATVTVRLQVRLQGKVFRTYAFGSMSTNGSTYTAVNFDPPIVVPKNADVRIQAESSAANTDVSGWFNGYLALVRD